MPPAATPNVPGEIDIVDAVLKPLTEPLATVMGGGIERAWTVDGKLFLLGRDGGPAHQYAAELPYPAGAREAAVGGRVVLFLQVWTPKDGQLVRVLSKPVRLQPMVCEFDEGCTILELGVSVRPTGEIAIGRGSCDEALARAVAETPVTTFTIFDRAVIPAMCRGTGVHAWNGKTFAPVLASLPGAAPAVVHEGVEARTKLVDALFPGSIGWRVESSWPTGREGHFVVFRVGYPAPAHGFFTHDAASKDWESGRAIETSEVWLASAGSFRRVMQLPTGLGSLAAPIRVLTLTVTGHDDELDVCRASDGLVPTATSNPTPLEAALRGRDEAAAARMMRGCGTYQFDGRTFVRRSQPKGASF